MRDAATPVRWTHPMVSTRAILFVLAASLPCLHDAAVAQDWPSRPVTMVVPFAAGGGTDVLGRIIGQRLSEVLGQQVIIENVGGAGGMVGSARVAKAILISPIQPFLLQTDDNADGSLAFLNSDGCDRPADAVACSPGSGCSSGVSV